MDPTNTDATDSNLETSSGAPPQDDFVSIEDAIGAKLDAAFKNGGLDDKPPVADPAPPTQASEIAPSADDSKLPGGDIKPPADKMTPPHSDPESDEALAQEIDRTTKGWEKKQREAFADKTYKLRELKRQNQSFQEKLTELEKKSSSVDPKALEAANSQLKELQDKISEYESKLAVADVTQTSAWQATVAEPLAEIDGFLDKLATRYTASKADLKAALSATGDDRSDKIAAATSDMNDYDRSLFFQSALRAEQIEKVAQQMRENARGTLDQLTAAEQQQRSQMESARQAEWNAALPKAWGNVVKMADSLTESDGADDWNAAVAKAKSFAETVKFDDLGVTEQAEVMHRAAAFPLVNSMVKAMEEEIGTLRNSLARYTKSVPGAGGSANSGSNTSAPTSGNDGLSFEDAIALKMREAGLA
jgi:hypothetical protein